VTTTQQVTAGGLAGAILAGAIAGGVGTVAAPIAGSVGLGSGLFATGLVNATAGFAAGTVSVVLDPCQNVSAGYLASSAFFGAAGGGIAGRLFPVRGMSTFSQVGFPRTWSGVIPRVLGGNAGSNAINSIYVGGGVSIGVGAVGPVYVQ